MQPGIQFVGAKELAAHIGLVAFVAQFIEGESFLMAVRAGKSVEVLATGLPFWVEIPGHPEWRN